LTSKIPKLTAPANARSVNDSWLSCIVSLGCSLTSLGIKEDKNVSHCNRIAHSRVSRCRVLDASYW